MATIRQHNWLGQQRVDIPHLRSIESGVAGDFDLAIGKIIGGKRPLIVKGFTVPEVALYLNRPAPELQITIAGSVVIDYLASESGSIFEIHSDRAPEVLSSTNPRVKGGFLSNSLNYVSVDFVRSADSATADLVQFYDENTGREVPKQVPLARIVDCVFHISTTDFNNTPGLVPVCKVTTDLNNNIIVIEDARPLFCRLAQGGVTPDRFSSYSWPEGRMEVKPLSLYDPPTSNKNVFFGGDKQIDNLKSWMDAMMTRVWEIGGGLYWYSLTSDRNVKMVRGTVSGIPFNNGEFFEWDGMNLHWKEIRFLFDNTPAYFNDVNDQTTDVPGLTDLLDGECIYVDLNRESNLIAPNALVPKKTTYANLGGGRPGARHIIAWRFKNDIYVRDQFFPVGDAFKAATKTAFGAVKVTSNLAINKRVASVEEVSGVAIATGITRDNGFTNGTLFGAGPINIGFGTDDTRVNLASTLVSALKDGSLEFTEVPSAPSPPAANKFKIFARDNGGVTEVVILWPDGTDTVIASH